MLVGVATFLMKAGLKSITPYQMNFLMSIGMLVITLPALLIAQKSLNIPVKELPLGFGVGLMMAAGSVLYVFALDKMPAGLASVLSATYMGVVVLLSWLFLHESFSWAKAAGLILVFAGTLLLAYKS